MGNRNYLHVCRHCGIVHATSSSVGPKRCLVCEGFVFSEYGPNKLLVGTRDADRREAPERETRAKSPRSRVVQS